VPAVVREREMRMKVSKELTDNGQWDPVPMCKET